MAQIGASVIAVAIGTALAVLIMKFMANRRDVQKLQAVGVPMPEFHPIFGHFVALKDHIQALPRNTTIHTVFRQIAKQFPNGVFYLNLWPFASTIIIVTNPFVASQVEAAFLDKPSGICGTMEVITGGPSLMSMHGSVWKKWRARFNPGFAPGYITGLAPAIADEALVFCHLLRDISSRGDVLQLEEHTLRLTFDVIARVIFDAQLHYQTQGSALADCLRRQILWTPYATTFNPFRRWLSPRPLVQIYNSYRMNRYLDEEVDKRFEELSLAHKQESRSPSRSIISLVMDQYLKDKEDGGTKELFKELVKPHLRMFLYAGNDTTSSTLLYCYYLLSRHTEAMAKVRAEHDQVFGSDDFSPEACQRLIANDPTLLNQIPYTLAVIKEVLRLFPPAGSSRLGRADLVLTDEQGRQYPTAGCQVMTPNLVMHNDPRYFVQAEKFMPERWLVDAEDALHPRKGSWRAFEWGPRNCIGQTLAQLELKVVLVMTVRMFDINPAYDEWDTLHPKSGVKEVDGNRAYQAELGGGGAHPADGLPVRVTLRPHT